MRMRTWRGRSGPGLYDLRSIKSKRNQRQFCPCIHSSAATKRPQLVVWDRPRLLIARGQLVLDFKTRWALLRPCTRPGLQGGRRAKNCDMGAKFKGMATAVALRRNQTICGKFLVSVSCASGKRRGKQRRRGWQGGPGGNCRRLGASLRHACASEGRRHGKKANGHCTAASSLMP